MNSPEVVEEVCAPFGRHEQPLIDEDVAVLDDTFWNSPHAAQRPRATPAARAQRLRPGRVRADAAWIGGLG